MENKNKNHSIAAIIIAKNEDARINSCLKSLQWVDEIIVIDNNSTDKTIIFATKYNAKIIETNLNSFASLRNLGIKHAACEWILYVDADEIIPGDLQAEIRDLIVQVSTKSAYFIKRENYYLGKKWPAKDKMERLFKRKALISWEGKLHEHPIVEGEIGELKNCLTHNTHRTLSEMIQKTNEWSEIEANLRLDSNHPQMTWWRFLRVMFTAFYDSYITKKGFKAGIVGIIESVYQSFSMFITYAKLWEKQINTNQTKTNNK